MLNVHIGIHDIKAIGIRKNTVRSDHGDRTTTCLILVNGDGQYTEVDLYRADLEVQHLKPGEQGFDFVQRLKDDELLTS